MNLGIILTWVFIIIYVHGLKAIKYFKCLEYQTYVHSKYDTINEYNN